jgi:hypothetical protein
MKADPRTNVLVAKVTMRVSRTLVECHRWSNLISGVELRGFEPLTFSVRTSRPPAVPRFLSG